MCFEVLSILYLEQLECVCFYLRLFEHPTSPRSTGEYRDTVIKTPSAYSLLEMRFPTLIFRVGLSPTPWENFLSAEDPRYIL
ncbi:unnamed protein product [Sphagnum balticum]